MLPFPHISLKFHVSQPLRSACLAAFLLLLSAAATPLAAQREMPAAPLAAQSPVPIVDATRIREATAMDQGWLVQVGDNPAWADPNFDDSQWKHFNARADSVRDLFQTNHPNVLWYRIHVKIDPNDKSLTLGEQGLAEAFEIYSNGKLLLRVGSIQPYQPYDFTAYQHLAIPEDQIDTGEIVLAVRLYISNSGWLNAFPGLYYYNLYFGQKSVLHDYEWLNIIGGSTLNYLAVLLDLAMLVGSALLYTAQRRPEYLYLAIWNLVVFIPVPLGLYHYFHVYPYWWSFLPDLLNAPSYYIWVLTYMSFIGRRVGWKLTVFSLLAGFLSSAVSIINGMGHLGVVPELLLLLPVIVLLVVILPWLLIRSFLGGNREAGILLVPHLILISTITLNFVLSMLSEIPTLRLWAFHAQEIVSGASLGPFHITWSQAADILASLSMALIILLRQNRLSRQQAQIEAEMANAREVQRVIVPEAAVSTPSFHVESVYEPYKEVGGDFFQVLDDNAGGLFVVVGDVAGKGLPAAMLVSVLVGAIRSIAAYTNEPTEMLSQLNDRLQGRTHGGFSTAIAAHIAADGTMRIANAGHLAPYLDGHELDLPGALPLGIDGKAGYETHTLKLSPGSRLTFLSDGVPEARNPQGELLGFDRTRDLATHPATEIAETAKQFGQSDDITVVTIAHAFAIATAA